MSIDLRLTHASGYAPGRPFLIRALWLVASAAVMMNPLVVSYRLKRVLLRAFGASVGVGVLIKPCVAIKYPWRLAVGDDCWIGERAWIDNMEDVEIQSDVVISQGVYLCTGNHDWKDPGMPLSPRPIFIRHGAWVGAFARVGPGVVIGEGAVINIGSVITQDAEPWTVYSGCPATRQQSRELRTN